MAYNLTNISNSSNALELGQTLNNAVDGTFGIGILLLVYAFCFAYFVRYTAIQAHIASSFICTVVGFLLFFMQFITWEILAVPIALGILGLIVNFFINK